MLLIDFIKNNKNWKEDLKNLNIKIKEDGELSIFNYGIGADFNNPLLRECRGVILDKKLNVVCRGFDKFGNYFEPYAADIDWDSACVTEKIDGSIVKMYFYEGEWHWATNSVISAKNAPINESITCPFNNFMQLIKSAKNYEKVVEIQKHLKKNLTYIFELVSPYNRIVIDYESTYLFHIGTRDNISGGEFDTSIGIEKPMQYKLSSMSDCLDFLKTINKDGEVEHEGFVVVDKNFNRIKIKADEYFELHKVRTASLTKKGAIELVRTVGYEDAVKMFPGYDVELSWYLYQYRLFLRKVKEMEVFAVNFLNEAEGDRKALAEKIKGNPYASFGFMATNGKPINVSELHINKVEKYIKDIES